MPGLARPADRSSSALAAHRSLAAYAVSPVAVHRDRADSGPPADRVRAQRDPHFPHTGAPPSQRPATSNASHASRYEHANKRRGA